MSKLPEWHRPKLTETQLNGEEKRLAPRGLFPHQVRVDLIRALASMGADSTTAACRALCEAIGASESLIDNILAGRMPIYAGIVQGLYGPEPSNSLPEEWANPATFGALQGHAVAAGLMIADPTTSPDPHADGFTPTVAPPALVIVADPTPQSIGNELPAAPETTLFETGPPVAEAGAPPAFSSPTESLRAPDAADQGGERDRPAFEPVQLREVPAAAGQPSLVPTLLFTGTVLQPIDPLGLALDELARQIQRLQAEEREAITVSVAAQTRARLAHNGRQMLMKAYDQLVDAQTALRMVDDGEQVAA